jgi:hypothetical protein
LILRALGIYVAAIFDRPFCYFFVIAMNRPGL